MVSTTAPTLADARFVSRPAHRNDVALLGFDFGSTTSSAVVARAHIANHPVSGKVELAEPRILYRSAPVFTPFHDGSIDAPRLLDLVDQWIAESNIDPADLFAGGTIITGLAAKRDNAKVIAELIRARIGESLVATADDPRFESWLAFMGSAAPLSRVHHDRAFLNLDIGGGTTNPAWGCNGRVTGTACYFVGARHYEFTPGTYRLTRISEYGLQLLQHLQLEARVGNTMPQGARETILDYYVSALEAIVSGDAAFFENTVGRRLEQAAPSNTRMSAPTVLFSGGVGELLYAMRSSNDAQWTTTQFGDLGIDLAHKITRSPSLSRDLDRFVPEQLGRATVYGLALHSTEVSGRTVFLTDAKLLPLSNVPIVSRIALHATTDDIDAALEAAFSVATTACIQIEDNIDMRDASHAEQIKAFAQHVGEHWHQRTRSHAKTLLLLTSGNIGKSLGSYVTRWRTLAIDLVVIDEITDRNAHFLNVGTPLDDVIPVSLYGIH